MIKFIHAADLHLDTPFHGLEEISEELAKMMHEAPFESFRKIIDRAIEEAVDFLLLSGDLYNTQKINIKAQSFFIKQINRLKELEIPVFLIRGNHDFLTEKSRKLSLQLPDNVYSYSEEVETKSIVTKNNKKVAISAFSYESQWIQERKIGEYPEKYEDVDFHIGMLHGEMKHSKESESHYAPFTLKELAKKKYDYWALGHIHQRQKIASHPLAVYPGNIQALHRNELGDKGCLLVEWSDRETKVDFIPTAPIVWEEVTVNLEKTEDINQLIDQINQKLIQKDFTESYLIHLMVKVHSESNEEIIKFLQKKDSSKDLTSQLAFDKLWITAIDLIVQSEKKSRSLEKLYPKEWSNAVTHAKEKEVFSEITEDILLNIPDKYLIEKNTTDYRKKMIEKAIAKIYLK